VADKIVALGKTCSIIEQDGFAELNSEEGSYVRSFALNSEFRKAEKLETEPIGLLKS
jgi:hypothetical protein